jgi:hypothetical protein
LRRTHTCLATRCGAGVQVSLSSNNTCEGAYLYVNSTKTLFHMRMWFKRDDTRRFVVWALLKPNWITAVNRATPHHGSVNTDVGLIVLGCRA